MTRGRKKIKTSEEEYPLVDPKYKIEHKAFDFIKNVGVQRDSFILEQFGVPRPPSHLNFKLNSNLDQFNIVVNTFYKYSEQLLENLDKCQDERFVKRKTMFIKLVKAVNLKFICAFRWKYYDRMLLKSIDMNLLRTNYNIQKVKEYLQIYQTLWQEHCKSMQRLLIEWNDSRAIFDVYNLDPPGETEISEVMSKLNELVENCEKNNSKTVGSSNKETSRKEKDKENSDRGDNDKEDKNNEEVKNKEEENGHVSNKLALRDLLMNVPCDLKYHDSLEGLKDRIQNLKFTRINQLQLMVNRTIGKYEEMLNNVESYNEILIQLSSRISERLFKKMSIKDYIKLIQEMPHTG